MSSAGAWSGKWGTVKARYEKKGWPGCFSACSFRQRIAWSA
jgi:hypothetical protein